MDTKNPSALLSTPNGSIGEVCDTHTVSTIAAHFTHINNNHGAEPLMATPTIAIHRWSWLVYLL